MRLMQVSDDCSLGNPNCRKEAFGLLEGWSCSSWKGQEQLLARIVVVVVVDRCVLSIGKAVWSSPCPGTHSEMQISFLDTNRFDTRADFQNYSHVSSSMPKRYILELACSRLPHLYFRMACRNPQPFHLPILEFLCAQISILIESC